MKLIIISKISFLLVFISLAGEELTFISNELTTDGDAIRRALLPEALILLSTQKNNDAQFVVHFAASEGLDFSSENETLVYLIRSPVTQGNEVETFREFITYEDVLIVPVRGKHTDGKLTFDLIESDEINDRSDLFFTLRAKDGTYSPSEADSGYSLEKRRLPLAETIAEIPSGIHRIEALKVLELFTIQAEPSIPKERWSFSKLSDSGSILSDTVEGLFTDFISSQKSGDLLKMQTNLTDVGIKEVQDEIERMGKDRYVTFMKGYRSSSDRREKIIATVMPTFGEYGFIATVTMVKGRPMWFALYRIVEKDGEYLIDGLEPDIVVNDSKEFFSEVFLILKSEKSFFTNIM